MKKLQKKLKKYNCEKCDYHSSDKNDYQRHLRTRKHKMDNMDNNRITKKTAHQCMVCGRTYKYRSGLSKHKRKCSPRDDVGSARVDQGPDASIPVVDGEKESLKKEVVQLRQMMQDVIKAQAAANTNFHDTLNRMIPKVGNTTNNKLSINVFLNEKCKHAMNITDFVDKLTVSLEDLMYTRDHGFVKGISNIFVKQLQDMKPTERPIHCSDKKRLQFYIKDEDKWERDSGNTKLDKTIEDVTIKQIKQIKIWEKEHPNYLTDEKLLMEWHTMIHNVMGGDEDEARAKNKGSIKREIGQTVEVKDELIEG